MPNIMQETWNLLLNGQTWNLPSWSLHFSEDDRHVLNADMNLQVRQVQPRKRTVCFGECDQNFSHVVNTKDFFFIFSGEKPEIFTVGENQNMRNLASD